MKLFFLYNHLPVLVVVDCSMLLNAVVEASILISLAVFKTAMTKSAQGTSWSQHAKILVGMLRKAVLLIRYEPLTISCDW